METHHHHLMSLLSFLLLTVTVSVAVRADFPITRAAGTDRSPAIIYNSQGHEYLVAWIHADAWAMGPLMIQRYSESGKPVDSARILVAYVTGTVSLACNQAQNEYMVAYVSGIAPDLAIYGQRLDAFGQKIGGSQMLMNGRYPRLLYNSLAGTYLLTGVCPVLSGNDIFSMRVSAIGQPLSWPLNVTQSPSVSGHERYAIAYAPISSSETPTGRYLLARAPVTLMMLDSDGKPIQTFQSPDGKYTEPWIPLHTGPSLGGVFDVDIAYGDTAGYSMWGKSFLVVWSDNDNWWSGKEWTGIYGAYVDAEKLLYLTNEGTKDNFFPISAIESHDADPVSAGSWKPKVAFNPVSRKYMVVWRETPGVLTLDSMKVNHIRANSGFFAIPTFTPPAGYNVVLSSTGGSENPHYPALAANTNRSGAFVVWEDSRDSLTEGINIYGSLYGASRAVRTTEGKGVFVELGKGKWIKFEQVTKEGETSTDLADTGAAPPAGLTLVPLESRSYYALVTTTAQFSGDIQIALSYSDAGITPERESQMTLRVYEPAAGTWKDITTSIDTAANVAYGTTPHLSEFAVMAPAGGAVVTNTQDSGPGSLRNAILSANANPGHDSIVFNILATDPGFSQKLGVWTIKPLSPLPPITSDTTFIVGQTQSSYSGETNPYGPEIEIDGSSAGEQANGLEVKAFGCLINGLGINRFSGNGIMVNDSSRFVIVTGCYIGVTPDGKAKAGNGKAGIWIRNATQNLIGYFDTLRVNIIGGNKGAGVVIEGAQAKANGFFSNYIGTDSSRTLDLGNSGDGVLITGGATLTQMVGSYSKSGICIWYNGGAGIHVTGSTTVRHLLVPSSISRNRGPGILLEGGANGGLQAPTITSVDTGMISGVAPQGSLIALYRDAGDEGEELLAYAPTDAMGNFVWHGTVRGPNITALAIDTNATTKYNTSMFSAPYPFAGSILVTTTANDGPGSLRQAIMSANAHPGYDTIRFAIPTSDPGFNPSSGTWTIQLSTALPYINDGPLRIAGLSQREFIGSDTNPDGPEIELDGSLAGTANGFYVTATAPGVQIQDMVINHFGGDGIMFVGPPSGLVYGCYIGTDSKGRAAAPNANGITMYKGAWDVQIGGSGVERRNLISGNLANGIRVWDSCGQVMIVGNIIGLDRTRTRKLGNGQAGVEIRLNSTQNGIVENSIGGNLRGIHLYQSAFRNEVSFNYIGTDSSCTLDLGNAKEGIYLEDAHANTVGFNLVAYNGEHGIRVEGNGSIYNVLTRNGICHNVQSGILTAAGGNRDLAPPSISAVTGAIVEGNAGPLDSIEVFADKASQGEKFLGVTQADTSGYWVLTLAAGSPLPYLTATARDDKGNTSAFSTPYAVVPVAARESEDLPKEFALRQNYPNPFNPTTGIRYQVPGASWVKLVVYDIIGREVVVLVDEQKPQGRYVVHFDGSRLASGIYLYRMQAGNYVETKRMLLLR